MSYRKALVCRPEMLLLSNALLLSGCFSWGAKAPVGRCFAVPLSSALGQHNCFFSGKPVDRWRDLGKVVGSLAEL